MKKNKSETEISSEYCEDCKKYQMITCGIECPNRARLDGLNKVNKTEENKSSKMKENKDKKEYIVVTGEGLRGFTNEDKAREFAISEGLKTYRTVTTINKMQSNKGKPNNLDIVNRYKKTRTIPDGKYSQAQQAQPDNKDKQESNEVTLERTEEKTTLVNTLKNDYLSSLVQDIFDDVQELKEVITDHMLHNNPLDENKE